MALTPVARIVKPRGFRGQVWVTRYRRGFPPFDRGSAVWIAMPSGAEAFTVGEFFEYAKGEVLALVGVDGLERAEGLCGRELCLPAEAVPPDAEETFDAEAIVGFEVVDRRRGIIGSVAAAVEGPAYWSFLLETPAGEVEIPAVKGLGVLLEKDLRRVRVDLPGGYPGLPGEDDED